MEFTLTFVTCYVKNKHDIMLWYCCSHSRQPLPNDEKYTRKYWLNEGAASEENARVSNAVCFQIYWIIVVLFKNGVTPLTGCFDLLDMIALI